MSGAKQRHHPVPSVQDGDAWNTSSSHKKTLGDGSNCWRHDQVLRAVADGIATAINTIKDHHRPTTIRFHRDVEKPDTQPRVKSGLLTS